MFEAILETGLDRDQRHLFLIAGRPEYPFAGASLGGEEHSTGMLSAA
jgi:hypothetical protein